MTILVTGSAGFIGYHTSKKLLARGEHVVGIDSLNEYYDVNLKKARLAELEGNPNFSFYKLDISDKDAVASFTQEHPEIEYIVHLAAQAGVRYSLEHPFAYADANLVGHLAMIEMARHLPNFKHMVYASSSSVYGSNTKLPFSIEDRVDHPISLYAATKKSCELMSHCYSHLYGLPLTGLRFFTVYGPWGRPDMAAFIFTRKILAGEEIEVFNQGKMRRNFTYIDDIVQGTIGCLDNPGTDSNLHRVYNIGNNRSEELLDFIQVLETAIGKKAKMNLLPMQPGDVKETVADIDATIKDFGFNPKTDIQEGLTNFVNWYKSFYNA
jgi:UDP-glucuronate 4-epimerase